MKLSSAVKEIVLSIKTKKDELNETKSELKKLATSFTDYFKDNFKRIGNDLKDTMKSTLLMTKSWLEMIKEAWSELGNMVSMSYLTNQTTRKNAFTYGLSPAESYGFEQAKTMMKLSDEDLMYMDPYQGQKFREIMEKYSEKYSELYDSGFFEKYLDYQIEMEEFRQDIKMEFIEFFMNNKDLIKDGMSAMISLTKFVVSALSTIVGFLGGSSTSYSDAVTNNTTKIVNNNVKIDTTYNNSNQDQNSMLNPGDATYEQLMAIFNS